MAAPEEPTSAVAKKQLAVRRASDAAHKRNSKAKEKAKNASDYVNVTRAVLEFQIASLQAELKLLNKLAETSDEQKLVTLFSLLDKDQDGTINATELADGLRKIKGNVDFEESLALAVTKVAHFDQNGDGKLQLEEFQVYVNTFANSLGCTFSEASEMLVMAVLFNPGNSEAENVLAASVAAQVDEAVKEIEVMDGNENDIEEADRETVKEGMKVLFDLFDDDGTGAVDFQEVVLGMYKVTESVDIASHAAINALMVLDKEGSRSLNFDQFSRFIINVVAAIPGELTFHQLADMITKHAAKEDHDSVTREKILEMFSMDESMKHVMDLTNAKPEEVEKLKGVSLGRVNKLFDMWDLDKDDAIDFHELALGVRKFGETTTLNMTVEESIKIMQAFDTDSSQSLDRNEFALFILKFADNLGTNIEEMIDFMIVTTALKDNSEKEKKYINSITASDIYYWGQ